MPSSRFVFEFDPFLRFGAWSVRLETVGVGVAVLVALVLAALVAGRTPIRPSDQDGHLRRDDLLFVALGIVPGAVAGGRAGYVLLHLDYYSAVPSAILDPSQGGLQLGLAVVGGLVTGALVAGLLDGSLGCWLDAATTPVLVGIALGKLAMALGGSGQGMPSSGAFATAYAGPGPWNAVDPATPAIPAQLLEAVVVLAIALLVAWLPATGRLKARDGRRFLVAIALWVVARLAVASTWRDAAVLGPLRADQLISLGVLAGLGVLLALTVRCGRRSAASDGPGDRSRLAWPEPTEGLRP